MNERKDKAAFDHELQMFAGRFPNHRWEPRHQAAYWMALQFYDYDDAVAALKMALRDNPFPHRIPEADLVRQCAAKIEHARSAEKELKERAHREVAEARLQRLTVPETVTEQDAWVNEAEPESFDWLGRKWQAESQRLGIVPGGYTPPDVAKERFREFWKLWAKKCTEEP